MNRIVNFIASLAAITALIIFLIGALSAFHITPTQAAVMAVKGLYHAGAYMGRIAQGGVH